MGSFFSGLIQGYGQTALTRQQNEQKREDAGKLAEMNALGIAIDSGRLTDEGFQAAIGRIEELSDTRSKKGAESPLRSVLTKLRGQVPKEKRYQPESLDQAVQKSPGAQASATARQAQEGPLPMQQPGGPQVAPPGSTGPAARPRAFLTQQEVQNRAFSSWRQREELQHQNKMEEIAAGRAGEPKTLDQAWIDAIHKEKGRDPTSEEITARYAAERTKPIDDLINEAITASLAGNKDIADKLFSTAQQAAAAKKAPPNPNMFNLIAAANRGDPEAKKNLDTYFAFQKDLAKSRGAGYGLGRAMYQLGSYQGEDGAVTTMSNLDAINAIRSGRNLTPMGRPAFKDVTSAQRMVSESGPAIKEVRDNIGAFDNQSDRIIFGRILANTPMVPGQEESWIGSVANQALTAGLSDQGKKEMVRLQRLSDTVGTLRQALGMPSTNSMTALTLALIPGPSTPDSKVAADRLDQLQQMIDNAVQIPTIRPLIRAQTKTGGGGPAPTAGKLPRGTGKRIDRATAQKYLDAAGGDPDKAMELARQNNWKF